MCLNDPENLLLMTTCKGKEEIILILNYIKTLKYADRPDYELIRRLLSELKKKELIKQSNAVKFNLINQYNNQFVNYNNRTFCENSRVNLFNNFTLDSSLYIVNPELSNFSTNFTNNSFQNLLNSIQLNSTNNSSTLNNINFNMDNFTGINNLYNRINSTNNQDFSIKIPILKKKRRRISLKEECIHSEKNENMRYPCKNVKAEITKCNADIINIQNNNPSSSNQIIVNNRMIPINNYYLFIENLKHLKKDNNGIVPFYFPHNIGGVPGVSPANINPSMLPNYEVAFPAKNDPSCSVNKDGNLLYFNSIY